MNGDPAQIVKHLIEARDSVPRHGDYKAEDLITWQKKTIARLEVYFGKDSSEVKEFKAIYFAPVAFTRSNDLFERDALRNAAKQHEYNQTGFNRGLRDAAAFFAALIQKVHDLAALQVQQSSGANLVPNTSKSKPIFISHAAKDQVLIEALADLLIAGANIHVSDIFCSSLEGMGIPTGSSFKQFIGEQLQKPKLVVAIITPNYLQSAFCLCELGAAWILAHDTFPIVVEPLGFGDMKAVLEGVQAKKLDASGVNTLKDHCAKMLGLEINTSRWEKKRDEFLKKVPDLLRACGKPTAPKQAIPEEAEKPVTLTHDEIKVLRFIGKSDPYAVYEAEIERYLGKGLMITRHLLRELELKGVVTQVNRGYQINHNGSTFLIDNNLIPGDDIPKVKRVDPPF